VEVDTVGAKRSATTPYQTAGQVLAGCQYRYYQQE
jgi:hypothetical protein